MAAKKKMNALDAAITSGKKLPSKNKKGSVPPDYDVIMPGMGAKKPKAKTTTKTSIAKSAKKDINFLKKNVKKK